MSVSVRLRQEVSRFALMGVTIAVLSVGAAPARGQASPEAPPTAEAADQAPMEEIVVTGSLFKRTAKETASPVTTLTPEVLKTEGIISVADAIRSLAADNSGTIPTAFGIGFAAGSSGVALRGLTVNSTIVLIDGQRSTNYPLADDGVRGFVDLNTIPFGVLDTIQTLKDGASSSYGADAIGGVVNILLKKTYEGIEATTEVGDSQEGGGFETHYNVLVGYGNLDRDKFNFYINIEGETDDPIRVGERGYPFNTQNLTQSGGPNLIGGQPGVGTQQGSIYGTVQPGTITGNNVLTGVPLAGSLYQPLRPCGTLTTQVVNPGLGTYCAQNFQVYTDDQPQQVRAGTYARFTAQLSDDIQTYISASYFQNRVVVDGPSPPQAQDATPLNTDNIALPATLPNGLLNPNNPFAAQGYAALLNYSFENQIPSETVEFNHVFRSVIDVNGTVEGWDFDAAGVIAHAWLNTTDYGEISGQQLVNDVTNGTFNFINPSANSQSVLAALSPTFRKVSTTDMDSLQIQATHPFMDLPGGPVNFGFGFGGRYEAVQDPNINPNNEYQGEGQATTNGYRFIADFFLELDLPVLENLDVNLSGRYDHYSDFGDAFSPKAGVKWTAMDGLIFRGTFSQGFRAPSFSESGASASTGFTTYTVPASLIAAHGNDAYVQQYQLAESNAANPNLRPERSTSFTLGTVYEPVRQFSFSVDWYYIKKNSLIEVGNTAIPLADYYAGLPIPAGDSVVVDAPDPSHPNALARPVLVSAGYYNAEFLRTQGIDFDIRGKFNLREDFGVPADILWTSTVSATDILDYAITQPGGTTVSYLGYQSPYVLSSGAGTPQYKGSWINSFDWGPVNVTLTWNYTSGIKEIANDIEPGCFETNNGVPYPYGCSTKAFQDFDLSGSWQVNDQWQVYGAILNLFNQPPPFDPMDYAGVNYNPTYAQAGIIGRFFRIGTTYKFNPFASAPDEAAAYTPPPVQAPAPAPSVAHSYMVFFDFNKSDLSPQAVAIVDQAAKNAAPAKATELTVTGHTDTVGSDAYNMRLSRRRAESVAAELEKQGIPSSEIEIVAKGKHDLLVPTKDGVREPQNRRVTIVYDGGATS